MSFWTCFVTRCGVVSAPKGGRWNAGTGIHVSLVIITDIYKVVPFQRTAQGLDAHIKCSPISGNGHDGDIRTVQGIQTGDNTRCRCRRTGKCAIQGGNSYGSRRIQTMEDSQTAGRKRQNRIFTQCFQDIAICEGKTATLARPLAGSISLNIDF